MIRSAMRWTCAVLTLALCAAALVTGRARAGDDYAYTKDERVQLRVCVAMTTLAWNVASLRARGVSQEKLRADAAKDDGPITKFAVMTVDKVFSDAPTNVWTYSVQFYEECVVQMLHFPQARVELGSVCIKNALIAGEAARVRDGGGSREDAYAPFRKLSGEKPREIVDRVFGEKKEPEDALVGEWSACVAAVSD